MMSSIEACMYLRGYLYTNINNDKIGDDEIATTIASTTVKYIISNDDLINILCRVLLFSDSEQRIMNILKLLGIKKPTLDKDLYQCKFFYYSTTLKGDNEKLSSLITEYEQQYGEDEHSLIAKMNSLFISESKDSPLNMEQLSILVDKTSQYLD